MSRSIVKYSNIILKLHVRLFTFEGKVVFMLDGFLNTIVPYIFLMKMKSNLKYETTMTRSAPVSHEIVNR